YSYDAVGNRLSRLDSVEGMTAYHYDDNDRLLAETLAGQVTSYTYDADGNVLSRQNPTTQVSYTWDVQNRLRSTTTSDAGGVRRADYRYNAEGIRTAAIVKGAETRYLIDVSQ